MQRTFLDDLDDNCITHILRKLSPLDVFSIAGTCRVRASASAAGGFQQPPVAAVAWGAAACRGFLQMLYSLNTLELDIGSMR